MRPDLESCELELNPISARLIELNLFLEYKLLATIFGFILAFIFRNHENKHLSIPVNLKNLFLLLAVGKLSEFA
ncbi:MAG: hypothetical protein PWQ22_1525 [Archaeoglobaceae archaeon]|nr:hypothetical protein [Archaeoglobaceae archaeon]